MSEHYIRDAHEVRRLLVKHRGDWRAVSKELRYPDGSLPTRAALYNSLYRAGLCMRSGAGIGSRSKIHQALPARSRKATDPHTPIDMGFWAPAPPKPLAVVPNYRTNTVTRAASATDTNPFGAGTP